MTCTVCRRNNREEIDIALIGGESVRSLAHRTRLTPNALQRHRKRHVPRALTQSKHARELAISDNMFDRLNALYADGLKIKDHCMEARHFRTALMGVRELARLAGILAPMQAKIDRNPDPDILNSTEWLKIRSAIVIALNPYPEARQAVAQAMKRLESDSASGANTQSTKP